MPSPFEVLGLHPSLVEILSPEQLERVIKNLGKIRLMQTHPDRTGGDDFQFKIIGAALSSLGTQIAIAEVKDEYLRTGPGQVAVRNAIDGFRQTYAQMAGVEDNINRTMGRIGAHNDADTTESRGMVSEYFYAFFTETTKGNPEPGQKSGESSETRMDRENVYIRHAPGATITIMDVATEYDIEQLGDELATAQLNLDERKDGYRERIRIDKQAITAARDNIKRHRGLQAEHEDEIRVREEAIARMTKTLGDLEAKIKELKARIRNAKKTTIRNGKIDDNGYVSIDGKIIGRLVGISDDPTIGIGGITDPRIVRLTSVGSDLRPVLANGSYLMAMVDGKPEIAGILKSFEIVRHGKGQIERSRESRKKAPQATEQPATTAIVRAEMQVVCDMHPFQTLGLLPSIVRSLSDVELRAVIGAMTKGLELVYHPDGQTPAEDRFKKVNSAKQMLDDQETFRRLKAEYGCSQPEDAIVASIESNRQRILTSMRPRLVELGRLKGVLAREDRIREEKAIVARRYWELLTESLYGNTPFIQNSGDIYLHQSAGVVVTVREGEKIESHAIRTDGFDVLMGERRIVGSIPSERFETQEQASQMLAETQIRYLFGYSYLHVDPVLHVGGYLVEAKWDRKKGNVAEVVGVIEKIDAANVARQMAQGLEGKSPRAVSETGPKTRRLR